MSQEPKSILRWTMNNGLKNSMGEPFEWYRHQFLLEPLTDWHPNQAVNKSAQVGWSETMIIKAFYMLQELHMNIAYTLPTEEFLNSFVTPKVDPIIDNNRIFRDISGGVGLKEVPYKMEDGTTNKRFIYFKGAHNPKGKTEKETSSKGVSYTVDALIHDEASRSDQDVLQQMRSRVENSQFQYRWLFDNPTYPGLGADGVFKLSDQRYWVVKCQHCGWRQYLDWIRLDNYEFKRNAAHCFIDPERKIFVCSHCGQDIDDEARITGEWVAKKPSITDYRGYWLSQLCYVQHSVASIMKKDDDPKYPKSQFNNFVLGKPYIGSDVKVTREKIVANLSNGVNRLQDNAMGIDQGTVKWYVIGNQQGIFKVGSTKDWGEIETLIDTYNVKFVTDALPDQYDTKRIVSERPGRGWRAFYKPEKDQAELAKFSPEKQPHIVLIRREEMFDILANEINTGKFPIQVSIHELDDFIRHWESIVRIVETDSTDNQRFHWERIDDDHLAHATLYWKVAMMKVQIGKASSTLPPMQAPDVPTFFEPKPHGEPMDPIFRFTT